MHYLVVSKNYEPYYTNSFDFNDFDLDIDMYVFDLLTDKFYDGVEWLKTEKI